jgi:tetraacyldisaccharide 4'-kinase
VFFTRISYGNVLPYSGVSAYKPERVILVTGIANPLPMEDYLRKNYHVVKRFAFPDHHFYSKKDLQSICDAAATENAAVVTTEKDVVKMEVAVFQTLSVPLYYLPIETEFLKSGKEFDEMVLNAVKFNVQ